MKKLLRIDWLLGGIGICLAFASAFLPWHVYTNPQDYGPPEMSFSNNARDVLLPPALQRIRTARFKVRTESEAPDELTTASVSTDKQKKAVSQPFPEEVAYRILFASAGRVLLHDGDTLVLVTAGTILPGGERIKSIVQNGPVWVLNLDSGAKLEWQR